MNTIQFKVEKSQELEHHVLNIYLNNVNLIEFIKQYEVQFEPKIAGGYEGLNTNYLDNLYEHLYGNLDENDLFNYNGKTQVLGCNCGESGCWPLLVKITVNDETIVWSDFEQPHRSEDSAGGYWDYSNLKQLEFDKKDYEEQLTIVCMQLKDDGNN
jgi:hypothetical protein